MPKVRNNHAAVAQGLDQRAHVASSCPASSAAMANAKTTEKPTYPIYSSGGCMINPTSCRSGFKSIPSRGAGTRSEEHTSELQSLMRISYAVFCLKKKNKPHLI